MGADEVDAYLAETDEPKRSTLEAVRRSIRAVVPEAEECISYGMPAFRVDGKVVAGFAAFKNHLAYLPHSGDVLAESRRRAAGYEYTLGIAALRDRRTAAGRPGTTPGRGQADPDSVRVDGGRGQNQRLYSAVRALWTVAPPGMMDG